MLAEMVVGDPQEAARLIAEGRSVVLIVEEETTPVAGWGAGPGRLALLVGSLADPAAWAAGRAMAAELFGGDGGDRHA
jgi:hypothetical protein